MLESIFLYLNILCRNIIPFNVSLTIVLFYREFLPEYITLDGVVLYCRFHLPLSTLRIFCSHKSHFLQSYRDPFHIRRLHSLRQMLGSYCSLLLDLPAFIDTPEVCSHESHFLRLYQERLYEHRFHLIDHLEILLFFTVGFAPDFISTPESLFP